MKCGLNLKEILDKNKRINFASSNFQETKKWHFANIDFNLCKSIGFKFLEPLILVNDPTRLKKDENKLYQSEIKWK